MSVDRYPRRMNAIGLGGETRCFFTEGGGKREKVSVDLYPRRRLYWYEHASVSGGRAFECFYDSPPPMPATVSKPIPRLFYIIIFILRV